MNVYEGELRKLFAQRYTTDPDGASGVKQAADEYVERHYSLFEGQLERSPYFFGEQLSVLDIYVWMLAQWMDRAWLEASCPGSQRWAMQ